MYPRIGFFENVVSPYLYRPDSDTRIWCRVMMIHTLTSQTSIVPLNHHHPKDNPSYFQLNQQTC